MSSEVNPVGQSEKPSAADWNVLLTLAEPTFRIARKLLARWGTLRRTKYFNVTVMAVADPVSFLHEFNAAVEQSPGLLNAMSHVAPFEHLFEFDDAAEFETKAREIALNYVPLLIGKSFHVRLHRRGLKGTISTPTEERFLDETLLGALAAAGSPGRISFEDPDFVLLIETVAQRGGLALWTREELKRYPFRPV
jgi:tRNA(Ser,Leu) C12 N-acetylase TAN1